MSRVGFTGCRNGTTSEQKQRIKSILTLESPEIAHHGGCVGADIDFDDICWCWQPRSILTVVHPSNLKSMQGNWHYTPWTLPEKPPLCRNKDIVSHTDFLIAAPGKFEEQLRSGTWATVRYARSANKKVYIVFPDGSVRVEEPSEQSHGRKQNFIPPIKQEGMKQVILSCLFRDEDIPEILEIVKKHLPTWNLEIKESSE